MSTLARLISEFFWAQSTAYLLISTATTFVAFLEAIIAIIPVPVPISSTLSDFFTIRLFASRNVSSAGSYTCSQVKTPFLGSLA